jgi:hypothetical protein
MNLENIRDKSWNSAVVSVYNSVSSSVSSSVYSSLRNYVRESVNDRLQGPIRQEREGR